MAAIKTPESLSLAQIWSRPPEPIDYVLPGLAIGTVGAIVSAGGVGKTFLALQTALGIAIGRDVGRVWDWTPKAGKVVYLSLEDPPAVLAIRLHALLALDVSLAEQACANAALSVIPGAGEGLTIKSAKPGELSVSEWFSGFRDEIRAIEPRLVIIDTFNRLLGGLSENDAGQMGWVLQQVEVMANQSRCAVVLCHHVNKAALAAKEEDEAHAARGSSVITDNARWQVQLSIEAKDAAKKGQPGGISEVERRKRVKLSFTKVNYGPPREVRHLRRGQHGTLTEKGEAERAEAMAMVQHA